MANKKPFVTYITRESYQEYINNQRRSMYISQEFDTYRELKKHLKRLCEINRDADGVSVTRTRRNEWGQWFEYWELNSKGEPYIVKEGWN
jgi:hypothetical protein